MMEAVAQENGLAGLECAEAFQLMFESSVSRVGPCDVHVGHLAPLKGRAAAAAAKVARKARKATAYGASVAS